MAYALKANDRKGPANYAEDSAWKYYGDVNIKQGGYYWRNDGHSSEDYVLIVDVTPATDAGGADNAFLIESGSLYMPISDDGKRVDVDAAKSALSCVGDRVSPCGYYVVIGTTRRVPVDSPEGRAALVHAFKAYHGIDVDSSDSIRLGKCESESGDFLHKADTVKPWNLNLRRYVVANYL